MELEDRNRVQTNEEHTDEEYTEEDLLRQNGTLNNENPQNFSKRCMYIWNNITVEPSVSLYMIAIIITSMTSQNLGLEKACRVNLNFTDEICTALKAQEADSQNIYEKEVQKLLSTAINGKTYITSTIPCIIGLFVGPYSDKTGRAIIFLTLPIIGQILVCVSNILHTFYLYETNLHVFFYTEAAVEALSGGKLIFVITVFSYISTITTEDNRTFRMGMVNLALTLGLPTGMAVSGVLLKYLGYYGCYGLAGGLNLINLLYCTFGVKDAPRSLEQKQHDNKGFRYFCRTFFDLTNIKKTLHVILKKTPNNRRFRLCILLLVVTILFGPMFGEISVLYMSTRYRFNWDEVKFSIFQTYNFVTHTIGTMFSVIVLSKYLQWHDSILGIISTLSKIAGSFVYCFAPNEKIFYLAPLVEILNGTSLLAMRSIVSKTVEVDELGKINSLFGLTENLMPLIYVPLYTTVYTATMEVLPGAVFLMGALMTVPAVAAFFWLLYEHRKQVKKSKAEEYGTALPEATYDS